MHCTHTTGLYWVSLVSICGSFFFSLRMGGPTCEWIIWLSFEDVELFLLPCLLGRQQRLILRKHWVEMKMLLRAIVMTKQTCRWCWSSPFLETWSTCSSWRWGTRGRPSSLRTPHPPPRPLCSSFVASPAHRSVLGWVDLRAYYLVSFFVVEILSRPSSFLNSVLSILNRDQNWDQVFH